MRCSFWTVWNESRRISLATHRETGTEAHRRAATYTASSSYRIHASLRSVAGAPSRGTCCTNPPNGGVVSYTPSSSTPSTRSGSSSRTARTVARPPASRLMVAGEGAAAGRRRWPALRRRSRCRSDARRPRPALAPQSPPEARGAVRPLRAAPRRALRPLPRESRSVAGQASARRLRRAVLPALPSPRRVRAAGQRRGGPGARTDPPPRRRRSTSVRPRRSPPRRCGP